MGRRFGGLFHFLAVSRCCFAGNVSECVRWFGVFVVDGWMLAIRVVLRTANAIPRSTDLRSRILFADTVTFGAAAGTACYLVVVAEGFFSRLGFYAEAHEITQAVHHRFVQH